MFRWSRIVLVIGILMLAAGPLFAASGAEPKGWVSTDTYRVMNFTVLAVALFFLLRKPVANGLNARIAAIREQLRELETQKKAAEGELAKYNEKLAELDQEARGIVEEYIRQGEDAKARILQEAEASADKLEEQARRNIENEFARAKAELHEEVLEKALAKAQAIIEQKITAEDQERLVDEYLEKVVA